MTAHQKYQFETDFAQEDSTAAQEPAYTDADLAAARAEAFEEGRRAERAEMIDFEERHIAELLLQLSTKVDGVTAARVEDYAAIAHETADISMIICRKILPTLADTNALGEIEGLVGKSLSQMRDEPRVVIRVATAMVDRLKPRLDGLSPGFEGKLVLIGDENTNIADCEIMWADGGAERNLKRLWDEIDSAVTRLVDADETQPATPVFDIPDTGPDTAPDTAPDTEDGTDAAPEAIITETLQTSD